MALRDYRCASCGETFEALAKTLDSRTCPCGGTAVPVLSRFAIKTYQVDRSNFAVIAPVGADGKPLTYTEATRSAGTGTYTRAEADRVEAHDREIVAQDEKNRQERAKREAWRIVSAKTRTVI